MSRKYQNILTEVDGIRFASKAEANRYGELKLMEYAGEIELLRLQPRYPLHVNGVKVADYMADFSYHETNTGKRVVEDVKGVKTPVYKLKRRLMKAIHDIEIVEIA